MSQAPLPPDLTESEKKSYCEIVGQLLIIDLALKEGELRFLEGLMRRIGLSEATCQEVLAQVNWDSPVEERVAEIAPANRLPLMAVLADAALADGEMASREVDLIARVAGVMDLAHEDEGDEA